MNHSVQTFVVLALLAGATGATGAIGAQELASSPTSPISAGADARERIAPSVIGEGLLAGLAREVLFDAPGDGSLWAVADTYKAGFDAEGATFVPFLGSDAPRNWPVRFRIRSVRTAAGELEFDRGVAPVRVGDSVLYDRGPFVERYDLGLESAEQSFLVHERIGSGALEIELEVESELTRSTRASSTRASRASPARPGTSAVG